MGFGGDRLNRAGFPLARLPEFRDMLRQAGGRLDGLVEELHCAI